MFNSLDEIFDDISKKFGKGRINTVIVNQLPFGRRGMCIPPFGIYIKKQFKDDQKVLKHEVFHWHQYEQLGLKGYYKKYFMQLFQYGYDRMPMEEEAKKFENS